jgi:hypothetical protein
MEYNTWLLALPSRTMISWIGLRAKATRVAISSNHRPWFNPISLNANAQEVRIARIA